MSDISVTDDYAPAEELAQAPPPASPPSALGPTVVPFPAPPKPPTSAPLNKYDIEGGAVPAGAINKYDIEGAKQSDDDSRGRASVISAQGSNPDAAAKALSLAKEIGIPASVIEADPLRAQQRAALNKYDIAPEGVRQWVAQDPINARLTSDDMASLGHLDKAIRFLKTPQVQSESADWEAVSTTASADAAGNLVYPSGGFLFGQKDKPMPGELAQAQGQRGMEATASAAAFRIKTEKMKELQALDRLDGAGPPAFTRGRDVFTGGKPITPLRLLSPEQREQKKLELSVDILKLGAQIKRSDEYVAGLEKAPYVDKLNKSIDAVILKDVLDAVVEKIGSAGSPRPGDDYGAPSSHPGAQQLQKVLSTFGEAPGAIMQELTIENIPSLVTSIVGGMFGKVGAFIGGFLGDLPSRSKDAVLERVRLELTKADIGINLDDPQEVDRYLRDNPDIVTGALMSANAASASIGLTEKWIFGGAKPLGAGRGVASNAAAALVNTGRAMVGEAGGELVAGEIAGQPRDTAASRATMEALGAGPVAAASTIASTISEVRSAKTTEKNQERLKEIAETIKDANELLGDLQKHSAEKGALSLDDVIAKATASKLATRSPEKLGEFLATVAGADADVFVPAETLQTYFQDKTPEEARAMTDALGITDQIAEAITRNGEVVIPLAKYVTAAVTSDIHKAWREDVRLQADGFSIRQAQEDAKVQAARLKNVIANAERQIEAGIAEVDATTRVYEDFLAKAKSTGATPAAAQHYAALMAEWAATRAVVSPNAYIDAWDAYQKAGPGTGVDIRSQLSDRVVAYPPDDLDVLLNSIKSGKVAPTKTDANANEQFLKDREELATELEKIGVDPRKMTNAQVRAAIKTEVEKRKTGGKTFEQPAYHGGPHIFDKFDLSKVGTGEGAQAYGWGLYFASNKAIAEHYRNVLSHRHLENTTDPKVFAALQMDFHGGDRVKALADLEENYATATKHDPRVAKAIEFLLSEAPLPELPKGRLYHVEIPEDGAYLNWDKPLSEQSPEVQAALEKLGRRKWTTGKPDPTGDNIYRQLAATIGGYDQNKAASLALREAGIPGIQYLDGGSRKDGDGSHNYVLFDDSLAQIKSYEQRGIDLTPSPITQSVEEEQLTVNGLLHPNYPKHKARSRGVEDVAAELMKRGQDALRALGVRSGRILGPNPRTDGILARVVASEIQHALDRSGKESALTWYTRKVREAMATAAVMYPEIATDEQAKFAFTVALAVTSQGEIVPSNVRLTDQVYRHFRDSNKGKGGTNQPRRFPTNVKAKETAAINGNFEKVNKLIAALGEVGAREFMSKQFRAGDLIAQGYEIGGENTDTLVYGSAILGPKIGGGFYQNLNGNYDPVTMDLWFMRAWGRITGTLIGKIDISEQRARFEKELSAIIPIGVPMPRTIGALSKRADEIVAEHERAFHRNRKEFDYGLRAKSELVNSAQRLQAAISGINQVPTSGGQRNWMRSIIAQALDLLAREGLPMKAADSQAVWWYPEKELYTKLGGKGRASDEINVDYAGALKDLAVRKGFDAAAIDAAVRAVDDGPRPANAGDDAGRGERGSRGGKGLDGDQEAGADQRVGRTYDQQDRGQITPEVEKAAVAAYNEGLPSIKDQYYRWAAEKSGGGYSVLTLGDLESMYGEDDIPEGAAELARVHGSVVEVTTDRNALPEYYAPEDAPSLDEYMEEVVRDQGGVFPAEDLSDIDYGQRASVYDAFKVIAEAAGWTVKGRDSKYFNVAKAIPEGNRPRDEDGEEIDNLSVGIRIADHANTSAVGHAVYGKADVHINIAPANGLNDQHSLEDAAELLSRARLNAEGKVTFAADGREAPLFQQARGQISFGPDKAEITLFQGRDMSTLLHEVWHLYMAGLEHDASLPGASEQVKADWATLAKFVGSTDGRVGLSNYEFSQVAKLKAKINATGLKSLDGAEREVWDGLQVRIEQNEKLARAGETYLMEGKAPSAELQSAFRSFKNWLIQIYKRLTALNSPITPEIREVFDRLIATDEQIAAARNKQELNPIFKTAEDMDATKAVFDAYTKRANAVVDEAEQKLLQKTMEAIRKARTKERKANEKLVREEVTNEVMSESGTQALMLLTKGELPVGETPETLKGIKLTKEDIVELYGDESVLAMLPAGIYRDRSSGPGAMSPDELAPFLGIDSGKDLIERLMQIEATRREMVQKGDKRSVATARIAEETAQRMNERYGDPLNDGTIEQEAMAAIHSDKQAALMSYELGILARKLGHTGTITWDDIKNWAATAIGDKSVRDGTRAQQYLRAERQAGRKIEQALIKGDDLAAFKARQDQMVNHALFMEATKAAEEVDSARKLMNRYASAATLKNMDQDYLEQIHQLLEDYEFKNRTIAAVAERKSFEAFQAEQKAMGVEVETPPRLARGLGQTNYQDMKIDELRGLVDTIKQLAHLGRLKKTLFLDGKKRELDATLTEMEATAGGGAQRGASISVRGKSEVEISVGKARHWLRVANAELMKIERLLEFADGDKTGRGIFTRMIFRPIAEAQDKTNDRRVELGKQQKEIYEKVPWAQRKMWTKRVSLPELGPGVKLDKEGIIAIALNMGNEQNLQKMVEGEKWSEDGIRAVVNKHLTREEWRFVQDMWTLIDSQWPEFAAMARDTQGVAPPKVEAAPLETPYGTLTGGYYPIAYDRRENLKASKVGEAQDSALLVGMAATPKYGRPTTKAGSSHERTGFSAPLDLSLSVIGKHLDEVTHDIFHRRAVMDIYKIISNDRFREALRSRLGLEYETQFLPWLERVSTEARRNNTNLAGWDSAMKALRVNVTQMAMGLRVSTMVQQVSGYAVSMQRLGSKYMLAGMAEFVRHPIDATAKAREASGALRHRANNLERDIKANVDKYIGKSTWKANLARFAFRGIALADLSVSVPTWIGAYHKGMAEGMAEADAIYYADKMVRDTQGEGAAKDMAAFQDGTETWKIMSMFYSFLNVFYNAQQGIIEDARTPGKSFSDMADLFWQASLLMVVSPIMAAMLAGQGPGDEEDPLWWALRKIGFGAFSGIPVVRDVANTMERNMGGQPSGGYKMSPVQGPIEGSLRLINDLTKAAAGEEVGQNFIKNTFNVVGAFTGLPTGQPGVTAEFLHDVLIDGSENPQNILEWLRGLTYGPKK